MRFAVDLELPAESLYVLTGFVFYNGKQPNSDVSCPSLFSHGYLTAAGRLQLSAGSIFSGCLRRAAQLGRLYVPVRQHLLPAAQSSVRARRVEVEPGLEEKDETRAQVHEISDGDLPEGLQSAEEFGWE